MQLGWIDFSKEDKDKALKVMWLLKESDVLDELGFGVLRNAFANDFFPGISTLHTRPKYLYLVYYMLLDFQKKCRDQNGSKIPFDVNPSVFKEKMRKLIDSEEHSVKNCLIKNKCEEGVFGSSKKQESYWVDRTPLVVYWTGLRTYGFLKKKENLVSYNDVLVFFYEIAKDKDAKKNTWKKLRTDDEDEHNLGKSFSSPLNEFKYDSNWKKNAVIDLSNEEAKDLKNRIINGEFSKNSLFALLLKMNDLSDVFYKMDFATFVNVYKNQFPDEVKEKLVLATQLNDFYNMVMVRYSFLLDKERFKDNWEKMAKDALKICRQFNPQKIYSVMNIHRDPLEIFLNNLKKAIPVAIESGDYREVDRLIKERELKKKKEKNAKIGHPDRISSQDLKKYENMTNLRFNFRFDRAKQYIEDIKKGLNNA
ncbi:MAG: hypothetical protein IJM92_15325 [Fibrobacter sp.]|uniref:DUF6361 family protein n=1 Tax=Fibrobacter sp. TaxID=35828 RepID=UPI0025C7043B|nr:DUF6361 family protein [Fibrobacter sp.]MBQ3716664.1 hypothetical protein [Fibrobacter sp.]MBQ7080992.1 hypothetical protein [Fibrobacter sp.]